MIRARGNFNHEISIKQPSVVYEMESELIFSSSQEADLSDMSIVYLIQV